MKRDEKTISLKHVDYKDVEMLKKFITPYGRIMPNRISKLSAKSQRKVALAIKRARYMGLLPYTEK
jgi:small subunit ribosomal protein S18